MENSSGGRPPFATGSPRLRSRVTNGRTLFVEADGRGPWGRRFRDVLAEITSALPLAALVLDRKSWLLFRPPPVDFCSSRLAIGAATERARALAMPAGTRAQVYKRDSSGVAPASPQVAYRALPERGLGQHRKKLAAFSALGGGLGAQRGPRSARHFRTVS